MHGKMGIGPPMIYASKLMAHLHSHAEYERTKLACSSGTLDLANGSSVPGLISAGRSSPAPQPWGAYDCGTRTETTTTRLHLTCGCQNRDLQEGAHKRQKAEAFAKTDSLVNSKNHRHLSSSWPRRVSPH